MASYLAFMPTIITHCGLRIKIEYRHDWMGYMAYISDHRTSCCAEVPDGLNIGFFDWDRIALVKWADEELKSNRRLVAAQEWMDLL